MSADAVKERIATARKAQETWANSSFHQRRQLMATLLRCIVENCEPIARAACVESGKTTVDAMVGEILVTCEKLRWTISSGEDALKPEYRWSGIMNLHKTSRVQYSPIGQSAGCYCN
jgi:acyl-CoA reductase-like NAD-dependent aldehyde dehydrogenase